MGVNYYYVVIGFLIGFTLVFFGYSLLRLVLLDPTPMPGDFFRSRAASCSIDFTDSPLVLFGHPTQLSIDGRGFGNCCCFRLDNAGLCSCPNKSASLEAVP